MRRERKRYLMIIFRKTFPRTHATLEVSFILSEVTKRKQKQNTHEEYHEWISYSVLYLENNKNFKTVCTLTIHLGLMSNFLAQNGVKISDVFSFPTPKNETGRACLFLLFFSSIFNFFPIYHSLFFHTYVLFPLLAHFRPTCLCPLNFSQLPVLIIILCLWTFTMTREHAQQLVSDSREVKKSTCCSPPNSDPEQIPPNHQSTPSHQTHRALNSYSQLLKVKPIYRQVLYVPICILEILLVEMWNTLANTTYKLKKKQRWFVKLQVKKEHRRLEWCLVAHLHVSGF